MLNAETMLSELASLLDRIRPVLPGLYTVTYQDRTVGLHRTMDGGEHGETVIVLRGSDINKGLPVKTWSRIADRFAILLSLSTDRGRDAPDCPGGGRTPSI